MACPVSVVFKTHIVVISPIIVFRSILLAYYVRLDAHLHYIIAQITILINEFAFAELFAVFGVSKVFLRPLCNYHASKGYYKWY